MHEKVVLRDENGIWYFRELKDGTLEIIEYRGEENVVIIPDRIGDKCVSRIGRECFSAKKATRERSLRQTMAQIRCVAIPSSIKAIGKRAFSHCENLRFVAIQEGLISIDDGAFEYCGSLTNIVLPDSVTAIGCQAFSNCTILGTVRIPEKVTIIKEKTFFGCSYLKHVVLPSGIESIEDRAFCYCRYLLSIIFPDSLKVIGRSAFEACKRLKSIVPDSVESIGYAAFSGCENLADEGGFVIVKDILFGYFGERKYISIPPHVRLIGAYAFDGYQTMQNIFIPDSVTDIEDGAFNGCANLRSVVIPDSVNHIGRWAFNGCTSLLCAVLSKQVTIINPGVFNGCRNLLRIVIPEGVTSIESQAFYNCESLKNIYIPASVKDPCWVFNESRSADLTISAPSGSDAQWYAEKIGVSFKAVDTPSGCLKHSELLTISIDEMDISVRTFNCLKRAGIHTVGDLIEYCLDEIAGDSVYFSAEMLSTIRNMGKKSIHELILYLKERGLNVQITSSSDEEKIEERKRMTIDELDFSFSLLERFKHRNIHTVEDLLNYPEEELMKIPGWRTRHADEVKQKLAMIGLEWKSSPADAGPDSTTGNGTKTSLEAAAKKLEAMGLLLRDET